MRKVGLITVTFAKNYGSHLQSFALQETLRIMGYNPKIINIDSVRNDVERRRKKYVLSRVYDFSEMSAYYQILKRSIARKIDKQYNSIFKNRTLQFNRFAENNYLMAEKVSGWKELTKQCIESYDAVIVGSDQLWRPANIAGGFYTMEFVPDSINKIAYATSFGIDHLVKEQREIARLFLNRINHLSVREQSGQKIIQELIGRSVPIVSDPTLLMDSCEWDNYIPEKPIVEGKYILCYFLGANEIHWDFVKKLKNKTGLKIIGIPFGEMYKKGAASFLDYIPQDIGPFEFVNLIKFASYVCTDSFHGCAFSINYNKNLFVFYKFAKPGKMSTNNRIDNILSWSGLGNRLMNGSEEIQPYMLEDIDYSKVNNRVNNIRKASLQYLKDALDGSRVTDLE